MTDWGLVLCSLVASQIVINRISSLSLNVSRCGEQFGGWFSQIFGLNDQSAKGLVWEWQYYTYRSLSNRFNQSASRCIRHERISGNTFIFEEHAAPFSGGSFAFGSVLFWMCFCCWKLEKHQAETCPDQSLMAAAICWPTAIRSTSGHLSTNSGRALISFNQINVCEASPTSSFPVNRWFCSQFAPSPALADASLL